MTPSPSYKDSKGETLKLSPAGRQNDLNPVGLYQISNVNLYYNEKKFLENNSESPSQNKK